MKMHRYLILLLACFLTACGSDPDSAKYEGAVHKLVIDPGKADQYRRLLAPVGLDVDKPYGYTEYARIKRDHEIGIAGQYDFLLLSTGGNGWDSEALTMFDSARCGWETTYYSNHDLTILHEQCHDHQRQRTTVRILKAAQGRVSNLHVQ